ncbi:MAG: winged helix-turn-helix transcriptional regulator [Candidatus Rokubacteria bacterium]|nr:winged helix-turn-helix transcriptional regulator [Candidatus Rokubacteria bacterium]
MTRGEKTDDRIYELHASVCQILSNPTRLKILNALRDREIAVAELARRVGTSMPNLSQHLALLKARRVVLTRREGVTIYYRIANPKILRAFDIMREVLFEQLSEGRRLVKAATAGARRSGART